MLPLSNGRIWLYTGNADMRKQFDGLAALVQSKLGMQAHCGDWFVFINKRRTQLKVLYYHQGGSFHCLKLRLPLLIKPMKLRNSSSNSTGLNVSCSGVSLKRC